MKQPAHSLDPLVQSKHPSNTEESNPLGFGRRSSKGTSVNTGDAWRRHRNHGPLTYHTRGVTEPPASTEAIKLRFESTHLEPLVECGQPPSLQSNPQSQLASAHTENEQERNLLIRQSRMLLHDVLSRPECATYKEVLPKQLIDSVAESL